LEFDRERTLIGGPNESGKSTLVEALHRVLFLKAKGNTQDHRAMISEPQSGTPEVELVMECGGKIYRLNKRFGTNGTVTLAPSDAVALKDDVAEAELGRLLNEETGLTRGAMTEQWAHLWVWQGKSSDDPAQASHKQHTALLNRLQTMGGAGVMQSALDEHVAAELNARVAEWFNQNGKPKASSPWARGESEVATRQTEVDRARERWLQLEETADNLAQLRTTVATRESERNQEQAALRSLREQLQKVGELRELERVQANELKEAERHANHLRETQGQIQTLRNQTQEKHQALIPLRQEIATLANRHKDRNEEMVQVETRYHAALATTRGARLRLDLALAWNSRETARVDLERLTSQMKEVTTMESARADLKQQLAALPNIDGTKLDDLRQLEIDAKLALSTLEAMAVGITLLEADQPVMLTGQPMKVGELEILSESGQLVVGDSVRFQIQPGGGPHLLDARQTYGELQGKLRERLEAFGLSTLQDAASVVMQREDVLGRVRELDARLDTRQPETLIQGLQDVKVRFAQAESETVRLEKQVADRPPSMDLTAVQDWETACRSELKAAELNEQETLQVRSVWKENLQRAEVEWTQAREKVSHQEADLAKIQNQLEYLVEQHGADAVVMEKRRAVDAVANEKKQRWKSTRDQLEAQQPELLEQRRTRLESVLEDMDRDIGEMRHQMTRFMTVLDVAGSEDPHAALDVAEARVLSARARVTLIQQQARAVQLLKTLFEQEKKRLADELTRPFQEKVAGYLECLFGPGTMLHLDYADQTFQNIRVHRPLRGLEVYCFDQLSGGAREQTAVAVRLAMAEVLAIQHDGCLPVVLDDAFAYSDPERVRRLQDMLFLASSRGVQLIVLTCNPSDYSGLGGRLIQLEPSRRPWSSIDPIGIDQESDDLGVGNGSCVTKDTV